MATDYERLILSQNPDAVVVTTTTGEVAYWSPAATAMFGYTSGGASGQPLLTLIVPVDFRDTEGQRLAAALETDAATYEAVHSRQDGSLLNVDVSARRVEGEQTVVLWAFKDVTDLKLLRDVKFVEGKYLALLDSTPDATLMVNPAGRIVLANGQAERLFGYSHGELRGRSVDALLPSRFSKAHVGHRAHYFAHPRTRAMGAGLELYGLRKDGTEFPVEISLSPLATDEGTVVMSAVRDISERKKAEQKFRGLLESAPDAMVIVDRKGVIVLVNSQAEQLFGHTKEYLLGKSVDLLVPGRLRERHPAHRAGFFADPRPRAMGEGQELFGLRSDGTEFPVEISLSPLETEDGVLVSSAIRDITERRVIERALHEKNLELQSAAVAKDRFLATMSHELRTPMNAIIGYTGTLMMRLAGPLTADQERQLGIIQASAKHLLSLINDLLDLAKIESDKREVTMEDVDVAAIVEEVTTSLRPMADKKGIRFNLDRSADAPPLRTDRRALSQIVINLVGNAIKFTEAGEVVVRARREVVGKTPVRVVSVRDTGCGISPENVQRLFQAFTQLDSSSTRRHEGTGLGLYLSQKLAALIGGRLTCDSKVGVGSTFELLLPE